MGVPSDDTGTIDFPSDNNRDTGREVDAETYVSAAAVAFNNAALPPNMPEWLKDTVQAKASAIRDTMQADEVRLTELQQRQDEDREEQIGMWQAAVAREREWDQSHVSIGGVSMSGQDWDDAYELLSDPKMRGALVQSMTRKKGWSHDRAEKAADDALTLAQIAQRKKDGTITAADELKADEITRRNPDAAEMVKEAAKMKSERGYGADVNASASSGSFLSGDMNTASTEYQRLVRATAVSEKAGGDAPFASAPDLVSSFDAARQADTSRPIAAPAKPMSPQLVAQLDMNSPF